MVSNPEISALMVNKYMSARLHRAVAEQTNTEESYLQRGAKKLDEVDLIR